MQPVLLYMKFRSDFIHFVKRQIFHSTRNLPYQYLYSMPTCTSSHSSYLKSRFRFSVLRPVVVAENFRDFHQSLQANTGHCLKTGHSRLLPHVSEFMAWCSVKKSTL
jgi:hypothetical protein